MSDVYFADLHADTARDNVPSKIDRLFARAGFGEALDKHDFVAVKTHFGEPGNSAFLSPVWIRQVVDNIKATGARTFVTDANTIYHGERANAVDHLEVAHRHGFLPSVINAPVVIADGLKGMDTVEVEVGLKHFDTVKVSAAAYHSTAFISTAHFKGHMLSGFGGTIKNIAMGLASRPGKQLQHSDVKPEVDQQKCVGCLECIRVCPVNAIDEIEGKSLIDEMRCIGCGECTANCRFAAIKIQWDTDKPTFQEKMVEYFYGIMKGKMERSGFFNFIVDVSPHCDCLGWNDVPIVPGIGILASRDPIALDAACADLVNKAVGMQGSSLSDPSAEDKFADLHGIEWRRQLEYAEELGLGSRQYRIVDI